MSRAHDHYYHQFSPEAVERYGEDFDQDEALHLERGPVEPDEATAAACPADCATCGLCADAAGRPCQTTPTAPAKWVNMEPAPF